MKPSWRVRVHACVKASTYKYFLDPGALQDVWHELEGAFGRAQTIAGFNLVQISTKSFVARAPSCGNPITVVRKRDFVEEDIRCLHRIFAFETPENEFTDD